MDNTAVTLKQLRLNLADTLFLQDYLNLMLGETRINDISKIRLLKIATALINYGDINSIRLGYRIILRYSNLFLDYQPLYDFAINMGYIPISKFIENRLQDRSYIDKHFFTNFFSAFQDIFKQGSIFLTFGQKKLVNFSNQNLGNYVIVAPTSYGKSEIIISEVYKNLDKKVCIVVPTKALLAQTKKRVIEHPDFSTAVQRVITHPDMYKGDEDRFVAVLTQERLLRLLQKNASLQLDIVLVDEAHNILHDDNRATLLSQVLIILMKRKESCILKFFTPFISNPSNLQTPYSSYHLESQKVNESIKIERYFLCDFTTDSSLYFYDQFLNTFHKVDHRRFHNEVSFLINFKSAKNIIYINRPKDIEELAMVLRRSNNVETTQQLEEAYAAIAEYVHPEYNLLKCIRSGIVYHHGGMPEIIRLYVESIFSSVQQLQFIVTSSTLLEGVNIPAEKIFLLTTKIGRRNFSKSQFKNLIGRVCRFSEIFSNVGSLEMLEPQIFLIKGNYEYDKANPKHFLQQNAKIDIKIDDDIENLLMQNDIEKLNTEEHVKLLTALEYLENIEPNTVSLPDSHFNIVESEIAKSCYRNNVYDFDIQYNEPILVDNLERYQNTFTSPISDINGIMQAIYQIFIYNIDLEEENLERLGHEQARRFYSILLNWRINGSSFNQMTSQFIKYWRTLSNQIIYVGSKWGEIKLNDKHHKQLYVDLNTKTESQKINLAIVRIKEEQDFVDNNLMKYIEILNDLRLIEENFYDKVKYGTSDHRIISLLKNGFSMDLAKVIATQTYARFVHINVDTDTININPEIISAMEHNHENKILIFEINYHVKF